MRDTPKQADVEGFGVEAFSPPAQLEEIHIAGFFSPPIQPRGRIDRPTYGTLT